MGGCKLSPTGLGLAFGILWGVSILLLGLIASYYAYGHNFVLSMGTLYPGYTPSVKGSILGAIIAFIDAFIMGYLIAWIYNKCCNGQCMCRDKTTTRKKVK